MKTKHLLFAILAFAVSACDKDEPTPAEPSVEITSGISSITESSVFEGEPGDVIEFTVTATAPAGFKSLYIELDQRTDNAHSNDQLVFFDSSSPEVSSNSITYTFSRELLAEDFGHTDNFIRAVVTDVKDRTATKGFRLVRQ